MTYKDRDGNEITLQQWTERQKEDRVAWSGSRKGDIMTFWVGVDIGDGAIFETHLFPARVLLQKYETELDAIKGHLRWVDRFS